ncbi:MAG: hypothetical protein CMR00_00710 [[Chlorobium] sp. 445]|nr:MAG: hypothetical protein CMR00_00710 [[Chlorobium] sp. 445]
MQHISLLSAADCAEKLETCKSFAFKALAYKASKAFIWLLVLSMQPMQQLPSSSQCSTVLSV